MRGCGCPTCGTHVVVGVLRLCVARALLSSNMSERNGHANGWSDGEDGDHSSEEEEELEEEKEEEEEEDDGKDTRVNGHSTEGDDDDEDEDNGIEDDEDDDDDNDDDDDDSDSDSAPEDVSFKSGRDAFQQQTQQQQDQIEKTLSAARGWEGREERGGGILDMSRCLTRGERNE